MRENTGEGARVPGSIPGGGSDVTTGNHEGSATADAASEVGIAKVVEVGEVVEVLVGQEWHRGEVEELWWDAGQMMGVRTGEGDPRGVAWKDEGKTWRRKEGGLDTAEPPAAPGTRKRRKEGLCKRRGCHESAMPHGLCLGHAPAPAGQPWVGEARETRKRRKEGLCKRRGCRNPVAPEGFRLCVEHGGIADRVQCPAEGCTLSANATGFCALHQPIPKPVAEPPAAPRTRKRKGEGICKTRGCRNLVAPGRARLCYYHAPVRPIELPAVGSVVVVGFSGQAGPREMCVTRYVCDADGWGFEVDGITPSPTFLPKHKGREWSYPVEAGDKLLAEQAARAELSAAVADLRCQVPGCGAYAVSPAGWCASHPGGGTLPPRVPEVPPPRRCVRCDEQGEETFLGPEVGDVCTFCASRKCARKGCLADHAIDSVFCPGHRACAASATCDNLPAIDEEADHRAQLDRALEIEARSIDESPAADPSPLERAHRRLLAAREQQIAADAAWREAAEDFSAAWLAEADRARGKTVRP